MGSFGRQILSTGSQAVQVLAGLDDVDWKPAGLTLDWSLITAVSSDTTLADGTVIPNGQKGMEFGTILCAKVLQEIQTVSLDATSGTYTLTGNSIATGNLAYDASAPTLQAAIRAMGGNYAGVEVAKVRNRWTLTEQPGTDGGTFDLRITRGGVSRLLAGIAWDTTTLDALIEAVDIIGTGGVVATGSAGGPYALVFLPTLGQVEVEIANDLTTDGGVLEGGITLVNLAAGAYVVTYPEGSGDVAALVADSTNLSGGTHTATVATATAGTSTGTYGPYDSAATDGRQNLQRGYTFILNETVLQSGANPLVGVASDHPAAFSGGLVYKARLKVGGANPTYLGSGNQPSWAQFETVFPDVDYVI